MTPLAALAEILPDVLVTKNYLYAENIHCALKEIRLEFNYDLFLLTLNHQPRFSSISDDNPTLFCLKILITDHAVRRSVIKSKRN